MLFPHPPTSHLFPYTTLFRSRLAGVRIVSVNAIARGNDELFFPFERDDQRRGRRDVRIVSGTPDHTTVVLIITLDRKSTRLNSSHPSISYAVFCLKKKKMRTK